MASERISRRQFCERALGLGLSAGAVGALLAACGGQPRRTALAPSPMDTTRPSQLFLYNWSDYMPPSIKRGFRRRTGIEVVDTYFDDNEALLARLRAGATGYDVMVATLISADLLEPLDMGSIPNFQHTDAQFRAPLFDNPAEHGDRRYSVPYQWGTTGYAMRTDKVDSASVGSWADLWDRRYRGHVVLLNDEREDLAAALIMVGYERSGRAWSINTTDQAQLDAAGKALKQLTSRVRRYDSVDPGHSMFAGDAWLTMCWNGDVVYAIDELGHTKGEKLLRYVLPKEGFPWWVDCMAIPVGYRSKHAAHLFMDYVLQPQVMGRLSSWTRYLPVEMEAARAYTDPFVYSTAPTAEDMQRGQCFSGVGRLRDNYDDSWSKVKST
jgi:spermidine/putrescine-binding protein